LVFNVGTDVALFWTFDDWGEDASDMQKRRKKRIPERRNILRLPDPEPYHKEYLIEDKTSGAKAGKRDSHGER
jgi:hypothetical protein